METAGSSREAPQSDVKAPHAVVAVGFVARALENPAESAITNARSMSHEMEAILVHDDRHGPYGRLILSGGDAPSGMICFPDGNKVAMDVDSIIAPMPRGVVPESRWAHNLGMTALQKDITEVLSGNRSPGLEAVLSPAGPFRTRLVRSLDLLEESHRWPPRFQHFADAVRATAMPTWVWVTEAFPSTETSPSSVGVCTDSPPLARIILNATQLRFAEQKLVLASHVGDVLVRLS